MDQVTAATDDDWRTYGGTQTAQMGEFTVEDGPIHVNTGAIKRNNPGKILALIEGAGKLLRGETRADIIELYSELILASNLKSIGIDDPLWGQINRALMDKFGKGTLIKIKEAAWKAL